MHRARRSPCLARLAASCHYSLSCARCIRQRPGRPSPGQLISWPRTASRAPVNSPARTSQILRGGQSPRRRTSRSCTKYCGPRSLPRAEAGTARVSARVLRPPPTAGSRRSTRGRRHGCGRARARPQPLARCARGTRRPGLTRAATGERHRLRASVAPECRGCSGAGRQRLCALDSANRAASNARAPCSARRGRGAPPLSGRCGPVARGGTRSRHAATMRTVTPMREKRPQVLGSLLRQGAPAP